LVFYGFAIFFTFLANQSYRSAVNDMNKKGRETLLTKSGVETADGPTATAV
jgi:hypothetical protein